MILRPCPNTLPLAVGLTAVVLSGAYTSASAAACALASDEKVVVAAVEPRLELRLADGRLLRLAGLDPALRTPTDPDLAEATRKRFAALVVGRTLGVRLLSPTPDRWGRLPAQAVDASVAGSLATMALAAGLGRYRAEPAAHDCRDELLAAEAKAREARLGLWADPYYAVLAVDERAAFAARAGTVILAEGRLSAVEPGPYRTRLRFVARDEGQARAALAATILPRGMKAFKAAGVDVASMVGKTIRLRGLLDLRFGPQIELDGPDELTMVDPSVAAPTTVPGNPASGVARSP